VTKVEGNKVDPAVQRSVLGCRVLRCKYSRGLPGIFESRPVDLIKIVITDEIGFRQLKIWDTHDEKNDEYCGDALQEMTF
jgi:hypothetical protein